jgi:uncharacterized protein with HEPN domain
MYDIGLVKEILLQIHWSTQTIASRFAPITTPEDFVASEAGREKLDAICMQLIAIGESIKHLDKVTGGELLSRYPQIEWKRIMGMRDVLSHHYFDIDAEVVYTTCDTHIEKLAETVQRILADLEEG